MNIELENNSAPSIEKFVKEKGIESIVFDLDNTLFATHEYYINTFMEMGWDMAEYLKSTKPSEVIARDYTHYILASFARSGSRPQLIQDQCFEGFNIYLGDESKKIGNKIIDNKLDNFYKTVPELYQYTIPALREICKAGINIAFHSHAQKEWTKLKVNNLKEGLKDLNVYLPFLATDISEKKDKDSWLAAFSSVGGSIKSIAVVGDSVYSDLVPPLELGCRHVVWLNRKRDVIPNILYHYKEEGKCIYMINDIGDLRWISDNNLI